MKRTSFVCFGAQGNRDALVYQEIPGRNAGEEFFVFFAPGEPDQDTLLRALFREVVSASRLGAPAHYFARFIEQFKALSGAREGDFIAGALMMIQIRRGEDVYLLCNRDAVLVHWDGGTGRLGSLKSLRGLTEVPWRSVRDQRDLFHRAAEDLFVLYQFTVGHGEHTLVLVPSEDFVSRHGESLRDSIFFPSFECPSEMGIELAVARSFPGLHWNGSAGEREERVAPVLSSARRMTRASVPVAVGVIAAAAALFLFFGPLSRHGGRDGSREAEALLGVTDAARRDSARSAPAASSDSGKREKASPVQGEGTQLSLAEAWKKTFTAPVTSSPRLFEGKIYFGCRDGYLYAFTPEGELVWKYRSGAGIGASPCCTPGRVTCANYRGDLFSLDAKTGKAIWSLPLRSKIVSTPQVWQDILVAGTTDGRLIGVRLKDAKRLWEKKLGASIRANPAIGDGYIIAGTTDGQLFRFDHGGKVVWKASLAGGIHSNLLCIEERGLVVLAAADRYVCGYSLSTGKRVWRFAAGSRVEGSPAYQQDAIFVGAKDGDLLALAIDGTLLWRSNVGGAVLSRAAFASGTAFVTTYASRLVAVDAATGRIVGEYRAASPIYSSPECDGKRVYFGSNGGVFHAIWLRAPVAS